MSCNALVRVIALLSVLLVAAACAAPTATASAPPPSVASVAPATATLTPAPTAAPPASATPIALPSTAQLSASGSTVWALVGGTRLFRSTDRGDTWLEQVPPAQSPNALLSFIDDKEGWFAVPGPPATQCQSQTITIARTTDTASSWQRLAPTGIADAQCKNAFMFLDATHGYLAASDPNGPPIVYRSADGGQTWTPSRPLPDPPGFASTRSGGLFVLSIRGFGTSLLADVGPGSNSHAIYRSSDGGATWTYSSAAPNATDAVAFVTATRWLQIGAPGQSKETTDAGGTWHAFVTDYAQAAPIAPVVVFADGQVGYATVRGGIQRTTDGGSHWTTIRTPGT